MRKDMIDAQLYFGKVEAAGDFPSVIDLAKSESPRVVARCRYTGATAPTKFQLSFSDGTNTTTRTATVFKNGEAEVFLDDGVKGLNQITASVTGTGFGTAEAFIDTYVGA